MELPHVLRSRRLDLVGVFAAWSFVFGLSALSDVSSRILNTFTGSDLPSWSYLVLRGAFAALSLLSGRAAWLSWGVTLVVDAIGFKCVRDPADAPIEFDWSDVGGWYAIQGTWEESESPEGGSRRQFFRPKKGLLAVRLGDDREVILPLPIWPGGPANRLIEAFRQFAGDRETQPGSRRPSQVI